MCKDFTGALFVIAKNLGKLTSECKWTKSGDRATQWDTTQQ